MRILILSTYYAPDMSANAVIIAQLSEDLAAMGHELSIVCAFPHYDTNSIWPKYKRKLLQRERLDQMEIYRVWLHVPREKSGLLGRLFSYVSFNLISSVVGLFLPRHDVILAPSPPLIIGVTAWFLSRLWRVPYVYNVQDIYPDVAVRLGVLTNPAAIRLFKRLERFVYDRASIVSVISSGFRQNLLAKGVPEDKVVVIPNFVDTSFVTPLKKDNAFAREHGLEGKFVLLFAGNVGMSQGLDTVLETAKRLSAHDDMLFLFVGNGVAKAALQQQAEEWGLQNVCFLPFQPRERVPEVYASADVCLIPLRKGIARDSVPSKALTIMAAGRPVIGSVDQGSDIWECICKARCGICVEPESSDELARAIETLYADPAQRDMMGRNGRDFILEHHTRQTVASDYHSVFVKATS